MTKETETSTSVPFRLSFAPLATLRASMDKDAADHFDGIWDVFPASLARLDESLFHASLHCMAILPVATGRAIADAFAGRPAAADPEALEALSKLLPCRVESTPDAPPVLVLPEELRNGWNDADPLDFFGALARTLDLVEYADAAVRLYGALSLDAFFDLLDGYGVSTDILVDLLPILVDLHSGFACLRHDCLFHAFFDEMDDFLVHLADPGEPVSPEARASLPPDAPVHKLARTLSNGFDVLPHYVPPIGEFLAWARADWFGDSPELARAIMLIRNSEIFGDDEAYVGVNLVFCLAQICELRHAQPSFFPHRESDSDLWKLAQSFSTILRLWNLNGFTADEADERADEFGDALADYLSTRRSPSPKRKNASKRSKRAKRRRH